MTLKNQPHQSKKLVQLAYPLVNVYVTMERSTIFNGKTHYKWQFSIAMLNSQRVPPFLYNPKMFNENDDHTPWETQFQDRN